MGYRGLVCTTLIRKQAIRYVANNQSQTTRLHRVPRCHTRQHLQRKRLVAPNLLAAAMPTTLTCPAPCWHIPTPGTLQDTTRCDSNLRCT